MVIGYNRTVSAAIIVFGVAGLVLCMLLDVVPLAGFMVFVVHGALMWFRPYFRYEAGTNTIVMTALLGRLAVRRTGPFRVENGRLRYTREDGSTRKVSVMRVLSDPDDWRAFRAELKKSQSRGQAVTDTP